MFTKLWAKDALERAISTAAQALLAFWGADMFNIVQADWGEALALAGGAAFLSLLKSVVATRIGDAESASLDPQVANVPAALPEADGEEFGTEEATSGLS